VLELLDATRLGRIDMLEGHRIMSISRVAVRATISLVAVPVTISWVAVRATISWVAVRATISWVAVRAETARLRRRQTETVTRRNVAGIEVRSSLWLAFWALKSASSSACSAASRLSAAAASKAFMVGP
jgi:hypothetical protein